MQHRRIATTAAMLADPSRAAMVLALMDGRSRSAKKLALDAGVTPQTASAHLKKLVAANILLWQGSGREKYFRIAGREVAQAVEALSELGGGPLTPGAREIRWPLFRCCTDWTERRPHAAGALGATLLRRYLQNSWLRRVENSRKLVVTPLGRQMFVKAIGVEAAMFAG